MFKIWMEIDGNEYEYGTYADRDRANEIAEQVGYERDVETWVEEVR